LLALQEEIAALGRRQRSLEDKQLELMEEAEPVEAELESFAGERDELDAVAVNLTADLAEEEAEIDAALAVLTSKRFDAAIPVAPPLLEEYEKLRVRHDGIAVARLVGGRCGGCHLMLSAVEVDRIKRLGPDEIAHCEECGRLLVR
jgi:predicted  nucleic acid-binding Zn-ribbon protein